LRCCSNKTQYVLFKRILDAVVSQQTAAITESVNPNPLCTISEQSIDRLEHVGIVIN